MPALLFVCTANLFRSPVSAALFTYLLNDRGVVEGWTVESAGTLATDGLPISRLAQEMMTERAIDVSAHRSRQVTQEILERSDLVLTMEEGQWEGLRWEFRPLAKRVFMLSQMVGASYDVRDPDQASLSSARATVREIESLLTRGFGRIQQTALSGASKASRG